MTHIINVDELDNYKDLSDVTSALWQIHSSRFESGKIPLAGLSVPRGIQSGVLETDGRYPFKEFSMEEQIMLMEHKGIPAPHPVHLYLARGMRDALVFTWEQSVGIREGLPEEYMGIFDSDFIRVKLQRLDNYYSKRGIKTLHNAIRNASYTGFLVPVYQVALERVIDSIDAMHASLMLASIILSNSNQGLEAAGIRQLMDTQPNFELIDPSQPPGIDKEKLKRRYGYGEYLPCPAAMMPTPDGKEFLRDTGYLVMTKVIEDIVSQVREHFDKYVGNWFDRLSLEERKAKIMPYELALLEGWMPEGKQQSWSSSIIGAWNQQYTPHT
jgi:hypothetical protein